MASARKDAILKCSIKRLTDHIARIINAKQAVDNVIDDTIARKLNGMPIAEPVSECYCWLITNANTIYSSIASRPKKIPARIKTLPSTLPRSSKYYSKYESCRLEHFMHTIAHSHICCICSRCIEQPWIGMIVIIIIILICKTSALSLSRCGLCLNRNTIIFRWLASLGREN